MRPPQQPTATFVLQPAGLPIQQVSPGQPGLVAAAPNALFSAAATAVQPRIRFIRPLLTTTNQPQQTTVINPTAPTPTAMAPATPARFVQLADGTFALIATAPRPPQPLQPQSNQLAPTVFIAGPGAAIATAAGATGVTCAVAMYIACLYGLLSWEPIRLLVLGQVLQASSVTARRWLFWEFCRQEVS